MCYTTDSSLDCMACLAQSWWSHWKTYAVGKFSYVMFRYNMSTFSLPRVLQVNWISSTAQQVNRQIFLLEDPEDPVKSNVNGNWTKVRDRGEHKRANCGIENADWDEPRRCLVGAARLVHLNKNLLLLKAKGAGLSEVRYGVEPCKIRVCLTLFICEISGALIKE